MVNSYRLNPNEYFTVTAARRNLCGDAGALFRIHKFLSKWGLINYQVNASKKPKMVEPPFTGEYETRYDAPRGLFPFQSYKPALQLPDMTRLKKIMTQLDTPQAQSSLKRTSDEMSNGTSSNEPSSSSKTNDINESSDKTEQSSEDKLSSLTNDRKPKRPRVSEIADKDWSQEEIHKLVELIREHGTDWFTIAKSLGTKTPEQCILRFLQLPIEDSFLMEEKDLGVLKFGSHMPFNKSDNPVMSTLAFLIGLVDPNIVQELTQRAIRLHEEKQKTDNEVNDHSTEEEKDTETNKLSEEKTQDKEKDEEQKQDEEKHEEKETEKAEEEKEEEKDIEMVDKTEETKEAENVNDSAVPEAAESKEQEDSNEAKEDVEMPDQEPNAQDSTQDRNSPEEIEKSTSPKANDVEKEDNNEAKDEAEAELETQAKTETETETATETQTETESKPVSEAKATVKDATEVALATLGLRSHVFATNQERLMNKTTNDLITTQLTKVDLKLKTLDTMEKSLELERKAIHSKQEDIFIQRLSLAKYATSLMGKFEALLKYIPENDETKQQVEEIRNMISDPPKTSISSKLPKLDDQEDLNSEVKPVSVEAPQLYRYWSG